MSIVLLAVRRWGLLLLLLLELLLRHTAKLVFWSCLVEWLMVVRLLLLMVMLVLVLRHVGLNG